MKAIVLAAGYATRLYPLTLERPKALLEVGGRPLLDRVLERVLALGDVDESIVVTNAKFAPQFEEWAVDKHRVTVVNDGVDEEEDRLGAIGDIGFVLGSSASTTTSSSWPGTTCSRRTSRGSAQPPALGARLLAVRDVGDIGEMPSTTRCRPTTTAASRSSRRSRRPLPRR